MRHVPTAAVLATLAADDLRPAFTAAVGRGAINVWVERRGMIGRTAFYVR
jgi:hypothetical protein